MLCRYPNAEPVWCQEEPMNMGAYFHVQVCGACRFLTVSDQGGVLGVEWVVLFRSDAPTDAVQKSLALLRAPGT